MGYLHLFLNTYTETEIHTLLYTNYTSLSFTADNFYDKAYLDNQFSLKADASQLTQFVTTDYLTTTYIKSVDLSTDHYNKTETDNMLLSYSTGSYVDFHFYTNTETDTLLADSI